MANRALCVGINNYPGTNMDLAGCVNDANAWEAELKGRGFAVTKLLDAQASDRDVKPISISDSFDFGLAICGIGEAVSSQQGFFYLKQNHVASQTGGDLHRNFQRQLRIKPAGAFDEILQALSFDEFHRVEVTLGTSA